MNSDSRDGFMASCRSSPWPMIDSAKANSHLALIRRVDTRLSESRNMVEIKSTVGNAENSSGAWMNSAVMRISTEKMIETASEKSSSSGGSGRDSHKGQTQK